MRQILHSVLPLKTGQVPAESYTERMKLTQGRSHVSKRLLSDKCENTQQWYNHLVEKKTALFRVVLLISQPSLSG